MPKAPGERMKFEAILFDLDGTLLDTLDDLTDSVNHALAALGHPARTLDEVRSSVGDGARRLIERVLPEGGPEAEVERCLKLFQAHYKANMEHKTAPYPGVMELLAKLRADGVKVGVVSNKFDGAVKPLCRKYFGDLVQVAMGEREAEGVRKKPAPDAVFAALHALDVPSDRALYVGDSDVDVLTARNAALRCLAVSWGFRPRESLVAAGADAVIDRVEEFPGAVKRLEAGSP